MKLKSKRIIEANEPVYDITVDGIHNFLVKQGIYVHNCDHPNEVTSGWCQENFGQVVQGSKDVADAAAQIVYSIFSNPLQTNLMDIAQSIQKSNITQQQNIRPLYYNTPKRPPSQQEAMKRAMKLFGR